MQATLAAMMLLTGNWILATLHTSVTIFHFRQFMLKKHLADVTEIFRQLKQLKNQVLVKLAIYLLAFVVVIYRWASTKFHYRLTHLFAMDVQADHANLTAKLR